MFTLESQHPTPRLRRALLPWLLAVAVPMALSACDGADNPLAPIGEPAAEPTAAPSEAVASGDALALTTGQRIVFISTRNSNQPDLYKVDPQGNSSARLTTLGDYMATPAWSYDNKHVVLDRLRLAGNEFRLDIYAIDANGSNGHWVRSTPFPYHMQQPSWSPNGSRIVLTVGIGGLSYLGWMDVATGQVNLFNAVAGGTVGFRPSYDATGQRILYIGKDGKTIEQMNADGSNHKLRFSSTTQVCDPTFSPDGKKIAFCRDVGSNFEIFVKSLVDGTTKRLTTSVGKDMQPSWSPDGSRIAFSSERSGKSQIWTMNATTGGSLVRITHTSTAESQPAWSH